MGKKAKATPATEVAPDALAAAAPVAPSSNPLAAMFAQSSVVFAKKASYVQSTCRHASQGLYCCCVVCESLRLDANCYCYCL